MAIEVREQEYAKEADDVCKLLVNLVVDLKAGKDKAAIASENLAGLMEAIAGADKISGEVSSNRRVVLSTVMGRMGELADALI